MAKSGQVWEKKFIKIFIFGILILPTCCSGSKICNFLKASRTRDCSNRNFTTNQLWKIFEEINGSEIRLDLRNNIITRFMGIHEVYPNIAEIILDCNNISELPENLHQFFPNLEIISILNNNITKVTNQFNKSNKLRKAYLDNNPIDWISKYAFSRLNNLEVLSFNNTHLTPRNIDRLIIRPKNITIFSDQYDSTTAPSSSISTNNVTSTRITTPEATKKTENKLKSRSASNSPCLRTTIILIFIYFIF